MERIQKLSIYFITFFNFLIYLLPISIIFEWCILNTPLMKSVIIENLFQQYVQTPLGFVKLSSVTWTPLTKIIKLVGDSIKILPFFLSLFALKSIFKNYLKGDIFKFTNAYQYRYLGLLLFLDALIAKPIGNMFNVLAVTLSNPKGLRYISITIGTPSFKALFCGAIVIVISWVILEAGKLNEERKLTI